MLSEQTSRKLSSIKLESEDKVTPKFRRDDSKTQHRCDYCGSDLRAQIFVPSNEENTARRAARAGLLKKIELVPGWLHLLQRDMFRN